MTTPQPKLPKLQCDICLKKDGWRGMILQQCCDCGVCVHEDCYGGVEDESMRKTNWRCLACQAVGTEIEGFTLEGRKHKMMKVTERPIACVLCSVAKGVHAMHALYHFWGKDGRQAILPGYRNVPQRLAWVHTLCALSVCQNKNTRGSIYGCDEEGAFEGDGVTAYFVMCGLNGFQKDEVRYVQNLKEHRELKCVVCGKHEKTAGRNLRVPLQCRAGDDDEFKEFKAHHENVGTPCTQAMHVGCAMWGTEGVRPQEPRHVWFFPGGGDGDEHEEPVAEIFCECHAKQMGASMTGLKKGASQKHVGSTVLQYTMSTPEDLDIDNAVETILQKLPRSQMLPKAQKDVLKGKRSDSSNSTKPIKGKSATGATRSISGEKDTQKSPPFMGSIVQEASTVTKTSDFASPRARVIQQPPVPITASISRPAGGSDEIPIPRFPSASSIPRRASASDATKTRIIKSLGGTTGGTSLTTIPQKAATAHQTPTPITASTPQRSSASHAIKQAPDPTAASISRRASASDTKRRDKSASPFGSTVGGTPLSTAPLKAAPLPESSPRTAKQRQNLLVPSHLQKPTSEHVTPKGKSSLGSLSCLSQSRHVSQSSELLGNDTFCPTEDEPMNPAVAAALASTNLEISYDDGKSVGQGEGFVPEDTRQQPLEQGRKVSSINKHKEDDAKMPAKRRRRRYISEGKDDDPDQSELDDNPDSQDACLNCTFDQDDCVGDKGLWMDDEPNGLVQGNELEIDSPGGEDPWAYLWKPDAPPFEMEVIVCAERRNVEGLMKSLYSKK